MDKFLQGIKIDEINVGRNILQCLEFVTVQEKFR
jgi:hypothetical protein